ncbi:tumor necrosis factor receptor superfamily member 11B-like [Sinocyclocheilus anshuiensis]|uniref:tumor necrosis factor receptor superfamily member 11B-like n=1 Tax=Sinocyclocheilus anshuiensis TaxID=1608454 RepID=UPI0007B850F4|nr:PREDICTED: tumor necrosis factor receptor superfamily member 11B-like [Sinocyclocheilus anshuiensis]
MFLLTALVLPVLCAAGSAADAHSYRRTDPVTGQLLLCDRCPPGTRLRAHCTRSRQTECAPCGPGLFTEFWNYIPDCLRCDACSDHQRAVQPCNGTVNTVCECEAGFFWDQHFCRRHSACKPGHGVKAPGTPHRDTVCELCADGHYVDVTQTHAACVTHSACKTDEQLVLPGSRWHDNVCATCDHLTQKGLVDLFKPVLSGLHVKYGTSTERLQKLVDRRLRRNRFGKRAALHPMQRLHWSKETSEEESLNLPSILEESHLNPLVDWIARKILRFQQHCTNTALLTV